MGHLEPQREETSAGGRMGPRFRRAFRLAGLPVMTLALLIPLVTPLFQPTSGSPYESGDGHHSGVAAVAEGLGIDVRTAAVGPAAASRWDPASTVIIVSEPSRAVRSSDVQWLSDWTARGGALVLADSTGNGIDLARELGVTVSGRPIVEVGFGEHDARIVGATLPTSDGVLDLVLSRPLVVVDAGGDRETAQDPIATSGDNSFVDIDQNGRLDAGDTRGPFTVGVSTNEGRVIVFTSGALFDDEFVDRGDNTEAVRWVLRQLLPNGGTAVMDTSHAPRPAGTDALFSTIALVVSQMSLGVWRLVAAVGIVTATLLVLMPKAQRSEAWGLENVDPDAVTTEAPPLNEGRMLRLLKQQAEDRAAQRRENPIRSELVGLLEDLAPRTNGETDNEHVSL